MKIESTLQFKPGRDEDCLPALLSSCQTVKLNMANRVITITLQERDWLPVREIGRLLALNGKYRTEKIRLVLLCPPMLFTVLHEIELDRLIWVEQKEMSI
ncbi:hypothetical protein GF373_09815 [bacterium]|nr:hypothetical protein [bacterium]